MVDKVYAMWTALYNTFNNVSNSKDKAGMFPLAISVEATIGNNKIALCIASTFHDIIKRTLKYKMRRGEYDN